MGEQRAEVEMGVKSRDWWVRHLGATLLVEILGISPMSLRTLGNNSD